MNIPAAKPFEPKLLAWFDEGSNLEHDWVRRFAAEGRLLSKSPAVGDATQTVFVDRENWLTGAADAIILPPFWRRGFNCEIKTSSLEKIQAMRDNPENTPRSHAKYVRQLKTYIALAYEQEFAPEVVVCKQSWAITQEFPMGMRHCPIHRSFDCETEALKLEPPTDGTLIYSSREEPLTIASYLIEYDPDHMRVSREKLAEWRDYYMRGLLPPHPHEGQRSKWSVSPCEWCDHKKFTCKPDYTEKVTRLADSNGVKFAEEVRGEYDFDLTRAAVLERWGVEDTVKEEAFA